MRGENIQLDAYIIDVVRSQVKIKYLNLKNEEKNISASITDKLQPPNFPCNHN
jgi:hypothetical protein